MKTRLSFELECELYRDGESCIAYCDDVVIAHTSTADELRVSYNSGWVCFRHLGIKA